MYCKLLFIYIFNKLLFIWILLILVIWNAKLFVRIFSFISDATLLWFKFGGELLCLTLISCHNNYSADLVETGATLAFMIAKHAGGQWFDLELFDGKKNEIQMGWLGVFLFFLAVQPFPYVNFIHSPGFGSLRWPLERHTDTPPT